MLDGLYAAAAGMSAEQTQLDAIGDDLANASSSGYRSERVAFSDLLYSTVDEAGTETSEGAGASARVIGRNQTQGAIQVTGDPLDLAIEGEGYFQISGPGGTPQLTRDGNFGLDANGSIVDSEGNQLVPPIKLPAGVPADQVRIAPDGTVTAGKQTIGRITLVTVAAPDQMLAGAGAGFTPTAASGAPSPTKDGRIRQGALEGSNVDMSREMALMVSTQRNFQMSSSAIQTESQMMSIANQLRPA